jgi:sarcosine oxidase delta subunit
MKLFEMIKNICLEPTELPAVDDERLLVQTTNYTYWFLEMLDAINVPWEHLPGCGRWIQFEIRSQELQMLMKAFTEVHYDILE